MKSRLSNCRSKPKHNSNVNTHKGTSKIIVKLIYTNMFVHKEINEKSECIMYKVLQVQTARENLKKKRYYHINSVTLDKFQINRVAACLNQYCGCCPRLRKSPSDSLLTTFKQKVIKAIYRGFLIIKYCKLSGGVPIEFKKKIYWSDN